MILIGLDLSLTSPGISVYDTEQDNWSLYGFPQRKSEMGMYISSQNVELSLFPNMIPPPQKCSNEERYEYIRKCIIQDIMMKYKDVPTSVVVLIESYAFGAKNAGSSYKLQELGGIIKHSIYTHFPTWTRIIVTPGSWKKKTVGIGNATKGQVLEYVKSNGPCIDLLDVFSVAIKPGGCVPCPIQDISDSICIIWSEIKKKDDGCIV